jgi:hypothetical protein
MMRRPSEITRSHDVKRLVIDLIAVESVAITILQCPFPGGASSPGRPQGR